MKMRSLNYFAVTIILLNSVFCENVYFSDIVTSEESAKTLLLSLYDNYKDAFNDDQPKNYRRMSINDQEYKIHVKKLQEVNGLKKHNLIIKKSLRNGKEDFIYINNPLESKLPKTYLTIDEFKLALEDRADRLRHNIHNTERNVNIYKSTNKLKNNNENIVVSKAEMKQVTKEVVKSKNNSERSTPAHDTVRNNAKEIPKAANVGHIKSISKVNLENVQNTEPTAKISDKTISTDSTSIQNDVNETRLKQTVVTSVKTVSHKGKEITTTTKVSETPKSESVIFETTNNPTENQSATTDMGTSELLETQQNKEIKETTVTVDIETLNPKVTVTETDNLSKNIESTNNTNKNKVTVTELDNLSKTIESTNNKPKRKLTTTTKPIVFIPKRKSTTIRPTTAKTTTKSTTKMTRRTYGRPMVFMGKGFE